MTWDQKDQYKMENLNTTIKARDFKDPPKVLVEE